MADFQASLGLDASQKFEFSGAILDVVGFRIGIVEHVHVREWDRDSEGTLRLTSFVEHSRKPLDNGWKTRPIDKLTYACTCLGGLDVEQSGIRASSFVINGLFDKIDEIPDGVDGSLGFRLQYLRYRALFSFEPANLGRHHHLRKNGGDSSKCFGLGNPRAQPGDVIALLIGVDAPVILRRAGERFKVVGDAYIRMYMYGEGLIFAKEESEVLGMDLVAESCEAFSLS